MLLDDITFGQLVKLVAHRGVGADQRHTPVSTLAKLAGISRAMIYFLISGKRLGSAYIVDRLARTWKLDPNVIEKALAKTQATAASGRRPY